MASSIGLPISRTMISASSPLRSVCSSATRRTSAARSATVVVRAQPVEAAAAAAMAAWISASVAVAYSLTTSPVAGLVTA